MEAMQQFVEFIETIEEDPRIGMAHMCLYDVLLYEYIKSASQFPIYVDRDYIMRKAKMCRKTYHKRLRELQQYGYIDYRPCCDPGKKCQVTLNRL